jgi:hypothetical protein
MTGRFTRYRNALSIFVLSGVALAAAACNQTSPPVAAASSQPAVIAVPRAGEGSVAPPSDVVVLPNNTAIHCSEKKLVALHADGEVAWELPFPDGDTLAAPAAAAASSVVYVRGKRALHAASPAGKWLWSTPLEGPAISGAIAPNAPIAMGDSTAVLLVGKEVVRLDDAGAVRWRVKLPEGTVTSRLSAAMDGSVLVPTSAGLYSITATGSIAWKRVVGG